jgi:hypothetical protein
MNLPYRKSKFSTASCDRGFLFALLFAAVCASAQKAPPPPKPADEGPSLEVTMKFIQDKLSEQRTTNVTEYRNNYPVRLALELTNAAANPRTCSIAYHTKSSFDGGVLHDSDVVILLKDVQKVLVESYKEYERQAEGRTEDRDWDSSYKVSPPVFVLEVQSKPEPFANGPKVSAISFPEETLAKRVGVAMEHAVALCGDARPSLDGAITFIRENLQAKGKVS